MTPTIFFFSFHGLVVGGWGLWTDRVFSLSPGLAQRTPNDNNNKYEVIEVWKWRSLVCETKRRTVGLSGLVQRLITCMESQVASDGGCERDVVHRMIDAV